MNGVHFVGIGGIGVSALARYFLSRGFEVSGSDLSSSDIIEDLRKAGAKILIGHTATNVPRDAELLIYSAAVKRSNPELGIAKTLKIKIDTDRTAISGLMDVSPGMCSPSAAP